MFVTHMMGFNAYFTFPPSSYGRGGEGTYLKLSRSQRRLCTGKAIRKRRKTGSKNRELENEEQMGLSVSCALCLIWTPREREEERERKMKIGRGGDLHCISHSGSYSTVELLASPSGLHRCFSIVV